MYNQEIKLMNPSSKIMKLFKAMKFDSISWSLRRWYVPVNKTDLVLEIGSGGNPYFRSNILCDADYRNQDHFQELVTDRPLVIAYGENLPFKMSPSPLLLRLQTIMLYTFS